MEKSKNLVEFRAKVNLLDTKWNSEFYCTVDKNTASIFHIIVESVRLLFDNIPTTHDVFDIQIRGIPVLYLLKTGSISISQEDVYNKLDTRNISVEYNSSLKFDEYSHRKLFNLLSSSSGINFTIDNKKVNIVVFSTPIMKKYLVKPINHISYINLSITIDSKKWNVKVTLGSNNVSHTRTIDKLSIKYSKASPLGTIQFDMLTLDIIIKYLLKKEINSLKMDSGLKKLGVKSLIEGINEIIYMQKYGFKYEYVEFLTGKNDSICSVCTMDNKELNECEDIEKSLRKLGIKLSCNHNMCAFCLIKHVSVRGRDAPAKVCPQCRKKLIVPYMDSVVTVENIDEILYGLFPEWRFHNNSKAVLDKTLKSKKSDPPGSVSIDEIYKVLELNKQSYIPPILPRNEFYQQPRDIPPGLSFSGLNNIAENMYNTANDNTYV